VTKTVEQSFLELAGSVAEKGKESRVWERQIPALTEHVLASKQLSTKYCLEGERMKGVAEVFAAQSAELLDYQASDSQWAHEASVTRTSRNEQCLGE
jgi:hypothetical protein